MKKTFIYIFLGWMMCAVPLSAQHWDKAIQRAEKAAEKASRKYNGNLNKALEKNISRAQAVHTALKPAGKQNTFIKTFSLLENPHKTSLLAAGWKLKENQDWLVQRILYAQYVRIVLKNKEKWQDFLTQGTETKPEQLARLIPADKKYIFMGEYHEDFLSLAIQQTIVAYARQHPEKKLIVFSEFIDDDADRIIITALADNTPFSLYIQNGIPWEGLEEYVPLEIQMLGRELGIPLSAILQGIRTRNEHWTSILKNFRQKYPDAVFFIHSGSLHSDYQEPYSVSTSFNPQESFVMQFIPHPKYMRNFEKFHMVTRGKYLRPGTLIWQKPEFARMAGFDVQVILPLPK